MPTAISLTALQDLLYPGLFDVTGKYTMIPTQWTEVFKKTKSDMAVERTAQMRYLPTASIKYEGQATAMDNNAGERYVWNQEHLEIGLGYAITRKAIDDNLYKTQFTPSNLGLNTSFAQTKEVLGMDVLNNGTTYNPSIGGDGVALFSTLHPYDGGVNANRPATDLDLNEAGIESALIQIRNWRDQAGLKVMAEGRKLVVPRAQIFNAERLTQTALRPGTANNDLNAVKSTSGLPDGYCVQDFLTSNYAWFIKTSVDGMLYMERVPYEMDMQVDFVTDNLLVKGYERYSFNYNDPLSMWGSFPTS